MDGYRDGVLWVSMAEGFFAVTPPSFEEPYRIYSDDYLTLGNVRGIQGGGLRSYSDIASEALELFDVVNDMSSLGLGIVCVSGRHIGVGEKISKGYNDKPLLPDANGNFEVLFWMRNRSHPFLDEILSGKLDED